MWRILTIEAIKQSLSAQIISNTYFLESKCEDHVYTCLGLASISSKAI
jgi:hypothetical protein